MFQNTVKYFKGNQNGLVYDSNTTVADLINIDTDGDGIPDWQEKLWGTDPTKKETTPGIPDSVAINKLRVDQTTGANSGTGTGNQDNSNLTETDKFSRDLFATVSATTQNGQSMDASAIDNISSSLAEKIQNPAVRKVFSLSDLKTTKDNSVGAIQKYKNGLIKIYTNNPTKNNVADVVKEFVGDGTNPNEEALQKLDPVIKQLEEIINERVKLQVPDQLAQQHLDVINALERVVENLADIKLYSTDPVVTIGAMSVYGKNTASLQLSLDVLANTLQKRLKD